MSNFKDFLKPTNSSSDVQTLGQALAKNISAIKLHLSHTALDIPSDARNKFAHEVTKLAASDEVLTELSQSIGIPKKIETEDQFVMRAKSTLRNILKRKLMK